eukprot:1435285-Rhodomonas_salina.1
MEHGRLPQLRSSRDDLATTLTWSRASEGAEAEVTWQVEMEDKLTGLTFKLIYTVACLLPLPDLRKCR